MTAHLKEDIDKVAFLKAVQRCRGGVLMVTDQGDRIDLKSTLSSYLFAVMTREEMRENPFAILLAEGDFDRLAAYLAEPAGGGKDRGSM